jgi:hypothetical protein
MSTKYKYPSELLYEATALADNDWVVVQKDGESRLSKITGANFIDADLRAIAGLTPADGKFIVGDGSTWVAESGATARASLGLTIDTHVQAYNAGLADISGLAKTNGNFIVGDNTNWVAESGDTARASLGLTIGTHVQAYNANLQTISGLNETEGDLLVANSSGWTATNYVTGGWYLVMPGNNSTTPTYTHTNDTNTGICFNAADTLGLVAGGTIRAYVNSSGLNTLAILPAADSTYTIGVDANRYFRGWFDELYTGKLQSGEILPVTDDAYNLGSSGKRWNDIWATNNVIQTSDERQKTDIADGDLGLDFINALHPVKFRWRMGGGMDTGAKDADGQPIMTPRPGVRFHYGLLADEVKTALGERDFGGYVEDAESGRKGLRYSQLVSVLIKAMQELHGQFKEERQARLNMEQRLAAMEMALGPIGAGKSKV